MKWKGRNASFRNAVQHPRYYTKDCQSGTLAWNRTVDRFVDLCRPVSKLAVSIRFPIDLLLPEAKFRSCRNFHDAFDDGVNRSWDRRPRDTSSQPGNDERFVRLAREKRNEIFHGDSCNLFKSSGHRAHGAQLFAHWPERPGSLNLFSFPASS